MSPLLARARARSGVEAEDFAVVRADEQPGAGGIDGRGHPHVASRQRTVVPPSPAFGAGGGDGHHLGIGPSRVLREGREIEIAAFHNIRGEHPER